MDPPPAGGSRRAHGPTDKGGKARHRLGLKKGSVPAASTPGAPPPVTGPPATHCPTSSTPTPTVPPPAAPTWSPTAPTSSMPQGAGWGTIPPDFAFVQGNQQGPNPWYIRFQYVPPRASVETLGLTPRVDGEERPHPEVNQELAPSTLPPCIGAIHAVAWAPPSGRMLTTTPPGCQTMARAHDPPMVEPPITLSLASLCAARSPNRASLPHEILPLISCKTTSVTPHDSEPQREQQGQGRAT
ncbi:hypothetical protein BDA96_10G223400 [Sorghum bicolor]|uniref:Uncharacterized protein n=1 Tax=Sorghum bicolor TaxID=4558 RepID=A0A921Q3W3_SORBI|nr:hypothetical protein BDA96_10G223400 [Sorghum bicolor]